MEITIAEMFLGVYAVAMTYLWQKEKDNNKEQAAFVAQVFLDLHDGNATMVVKNNDEGGRTVNIKGGRTANINREDAL
jgi:hypothetical protein